MALDPVTAHVEQMYTVFPFPRVVSIEQPLTRDFRRHSLNLMLRRREADAFRADLKVWIAGCGTRQGVQIATWFPGGTVLATDLSDASLEIERKLAAQLDVHNVRFERENILEARHDGEFDFIVSTGVLHHLADPVRGFRNVRRALKPSGAALILLYNRQIRRPYTTVQRVLQELAPDVTVNEVRFSLARKLVEAILASPHSSELHEPLQVIHQTLVEGDASNFADVFCHPNERDYDIPSLLQFIHDGGCRFAGWMWPELWNPRRYLADRELAQKVAALEPMAQAKVIYEIAGRYSPELIFYVERDDAPARAPYSHDELMSFRPLASQGLRRFRVDDAATVTGSEVVPAYTIQDGKLVTKASPLETRLPLDSEQVLALCDGRRSVGEIGQALELTDEELLPFLMRAWAAESSLVAPVFDR